MKEYRILAINPGSTSTKIAVFDGGKELFTHVIRHDRAELERCGSIFDQKQVRLGNILTALQENHVSLDTLDAIAARGGLLHPIESGVYAVNDTMLEHLKKPAAQMHASSLAAIIARELADRLGIRAYIVDPTVVDELEPYARITGLPEIEKASHFHALNQKEIAHRYARETGKRYDELRLIIAHMGGGITVGAHKYGKVVDVNDGLLGEGPFTPERAGKLPASALVDLCYSGKYTQAEMQAKITRSGGMAAHLGTSDLREAEKRISDGDKKAELIVNAMAYHVSKEIGAMAAVLDGYADAILLTGGLAYSKYFTEAIITRVKAFAPVYLFPGEDEMVALKNGVIRILRGEEISKVYQ